MSGDIEKENIILQRFVWKDNDHKCEAGKLLFALTELTTNEQHITACNDEQVASYLKDKGLVETIDNELHLIEGKAAEADELGNQISDYIGNEIESLPVDKEIHFVPSIHMMAVPIPCMQPVEEKKEEK